MTPTQTETCPAPADAPSARATNATADASLTAFLAHIERRKNDTQYFASWNEGVAEYHRLLQEQSKRERNEPSEMENW